MNKLRFFCFLLVPLLLTECNSEKSYYNNKGLLAELNVKKTNNDLQRTVFNIGLKNQSVNTLRIVLVGEIRRRIDTTIVSRSLHDCILEVKQNGILKRSTELSEIGRPILSHSMPVLYTLKQDSINYINIYYLGNFRKDFKLGYSKYYVRILLVPEDINWDIYKRLYGKQFPNSSKGFNIIKDTIKTPFVEIKE